LVFRVLSCNFVLVKNIKIRMNTKKVHIITEGTSDIAILKPILKAAQFPLDRIKFTAFQGNQARILKMAKALNGTFDDYVSVVLLDTDAKTIPDAQVKLKKTFSEEGIEVFFVIPEIESWIFADVQLLQRQNLQEGAKERLTRLPLPEEIPYPRQLLHYVIGNNKIDWNFLEHIDLAKATARTPSLKIFLTRLGELMDIDTKVVQNSVAQNIDRRIFANMIKEVVQSETILYKTLDGTQYTAEQILENVEEGTEIGKQYTSDILRVARDLIKRQANR
jgi:hypothetical protein